MIYPARLQKIIDLFEILPDEEKREALITYAGEAINYAPGGGEKFDLEDIRKDEECTDTVGIFLNVAKDHTATFRITLGSQVQTLTRAMATILCKGFNGELVDAILDTPSDFVPRIIGAELVRARSQTTYYILSRIKGVLKVYSARERQRLVEEQDAATQ